MYHKVSNIKKVSNEKIKPKSLVFTEVHTVFIKHNHVVHGYVGFHWFRYNYPLDVRKRIDFTSFDLAILCSTLSISRFRQVICFD